MKVDNKGVASELPTLLVLAFSYVLHCRVIWWYFSILFKSYKIYLYTKREDRDQTDSGLPYLFLSIEKDCLSVVDPFAEIYSIHTLINRKKKRLHTDRDRTMSKINECQVNTVKQ